MPEGGLKAIPGKLFYRGYDVEDLAHDFIKEKRFGFEEVAYLLLSGKLPDKEELSAFKELLNDNMPYRIGDVYLRRKPGRHLPR